uniref:Putative dynein heavy chain cytoplasmic isoform x7 n=1 Tax=Panstrongylus lignarius TaxID=156445 RepID=A0A224Y3J3_9HEMI
MANPPAIVKVTLESICLLLGEAASDWKAIRSVIMKENFISTIVNFNTDDLTSVSFVTHTFFVSLNSHFCQSCFYCIAFY